MTYDEWFNRERLFTFEQHTVLKDQSNFKIKTSDDVTFEFFAHEWDETVEIIQRHGFIPYSMNHFINKEEGRDSTEYMIYNTMESKLYNIEFNIDEEGHSLSFYQSTPANDNSYRYSLEMARKEELPLALINELRERELNRPKVRLYAITGSELFVLDESFYE
jgi:hypothetical protein